MLISRTSGKLSPSSGTSSQTVTPLADCRLHAASIRLRIGIRIHVVSARPRIGMSGLPGDQALRFRLLFWQLNSGAASPPKLDSHHRDLHNSEHAGAATWGPRGERRRVT